MIVQNGIEVLNGARAVSGLKGMDVAAAVALSGLRTNRPGGSVLEVENDQQGVRKILLYLISDGKKVYVGLRRDFELLGLGWGRKCDKLDQLKARQRPTG